MGILIGGRLVDTFVSLLGLTSPLAHEQGHTSCHACHGGEQMY